MTVVHLKRHVDGVGRRLGRRIDRVIQTKADKSDVKRLEHVMNARFATVDARFDVLEARIARMDQRLNEKLDLFLGVFERRLHDLESAVFGSRPQ